MALLRPRQPDPRRRRLRPADAPAAGPRGGVPRAAHPRLAHAEGRRRGLDRVHRGRPPPADGEPRQRVLLRGARDLARPPAAGRRRRPRSAVRAQGRRSGHQPALRGRSSHPGADPRRRRHRRGRHPQRQDHRLGATPAGRQRRVPDTRAARGARRGVPAEGGVRAAQRVDDRGRQTRLRQPAQRGGRFAAPEGPAGHRDPRARHGLPRHRCARGLRAEGPVALLRRAGRVGICRRRTRSRCCRP